MATSLLFSRLLHLIKYGQWNQNDVVELFTALVKQHSVTAVKTDFHLWMAKILYQVEIHKINKLDLLSSIEPSQFMDNLEVKMYDFIKETKEKSLENILKEMKAEGNIDPKILCEVKDIVLSVSSLPSHTVSMNLKEKRERLFKICQAVEMAKGWKPRMTQMVSWCIMVLSGSRQLIQVGTGEGKSCIVAMVAGYHALIGESVDIISSSPVLAERDAKEWHSFYKNLGITVNCNANKKCAEDLRKCYACQVVYGTTQEFAGDWLRHRFQRENVRHERKFQCVIVDEVDSLMLDKGLEVVYLNSEMPAMEPLNVILAKIWFVVNKDENLDIEKTLDLIRSSLMAEDSDLLPSNEYFEILDTSVQQHNELQIPGFIDHINGRLKTWIENAFLAKTMTLDHEYILHENGVVPVDYSSTGVVQNDMKWGDGLQQFLEMKHQTRLSNMCMITNFKSNVKLFRSYKRIYGLTGTLGNQNELNLLQKLYPGIKTCKIPPFKRRKLYEKDGIVINDEDEWVETICKAVNKNVNPTVYRGSRAVLVICETIQRAQIVHHALSKIISTDKLKLYTNNNVDNSEITGKEITESCVIVATNLAGRGTDLKVCNEVNNAGGLFVVQTFLPLNIRVEHQAFGRTAREGNPGSAQLIMCSTHFAESIKLVMALKSPLSRLLTILRRLTVTVAVSGFVKNKFEDTLKVCLIEPNEKNCEVMKKELTNLLNIEMPSGLTNLEIEKQARDLIVETRLSKILDDDLPKIEKKEELFSEYLNILDTIYTQGGNHEDIVTSLHECWGMWLLMKFNENESTETLRNQLKKALQSAKTKLYSDQSPSSMIYHYVRAGNTLRLKGSLADSIEMYTRAIKNNPCGSAIALYNRALSILSKGSSGHIVQALADLKKADEAVDSYMRKLTRTLNFVESSSKDTNMTSDTLLNKQFRDKQLAQDFLKRYIQKAIIVLQTAESRGHEVQIKKCPALLIIVLLNKYISINLSKEISNLYSLGLNTLFFLETVEISFFKRFLNKFI
ncbi:protein translocase subunit SecA 1-like [Clarias gariepinus]|uniref:protein translocase subunit SecA 1-like n=1 Tax=Clarias gariepinus TaxID=13013 RepID=UPI00234DE420|nr:protein translocase subunit SecA 1-like [Clarias gariepinus]